MTERVLIIANAAINPGDSNGRTILRLVSCIPYDLKAEFFVYGEPAFEECGNYYHVSDYDALQSFIKRKKINGFVSKVNKESIKNNATKKKKTPFQMILREIVWKYGNWKNSFLLDWVDRFDPKFIIVIAGDNCFTLDLARMIARKKQIPIILYSTEEYQFKEYNYITQKHSIFYYFFKRRLVNAYKKISKYVHFGLFNTSDLANLYRSHYNYKCDFVYNSSSLDWLDKFQANKKPIISYLGNLGLNRHNSLIEIANALYSIDQSLTLDIYGNADNKIIDDFKIVKNIRFMGVVPYEKVIEIIHNSDLLLHVESFEKYYVRDLKYAFSTKIADCVSSGTPTLIYAPSTLSETNFLNNEKCAFVVTERNNLCSTLYKALYSEEDRHEILKKAKVVKDKYFSNDNKLLKVLEELGNESFTN